MKLFGYGIVQLLAKNWDIWHHINEYVLVFHYNLNFYTLITLIYNEQITIYSYFYFLRAFVMFETLESWIQDKNYLGEGVAAELFDSNCLEGAMSFARKKHL